MHDAHCTFCWDASTEHCQLNNQAGRQAFNLDGRLLLGRQRSFQVVEQPTVLAEHCPSDFYLVAGLQHTGSMAEWTKSWRLHAEGLHA